MSINICYLSWLQSQKSECVKVVVRCRPLLPDEVAAHYDRYLALQSTPPLHAAGTFLSQCRVVTMDLTKGEVAIQKLQQRDNRSEDTTRRFTFDSVYDWTYVPLEHQPTSQSTLPPSPLHRSTQRQLYEETFQPIVEAVLQGYNGEQCTPILRDVLH